MWLLEILKNNEFLSCIVVNCVFELLLPSLNFYLIMEQDYMVVKHLPPTRNIFSIVFFAKIIKTTILYQDDYFTL